jgi:hypothetical protein
LAPLIAQYSWVAILSSCRWVLNKQSEAPERVEDDPECLAVLKDYRSLMPLAQEARKPMFRLRPADGAFGGHQKAVQECAVDFRRLARRILAACNVPLSQHGSDLRDQ